jgi:NADH-quinone oxidoreductase subunit A
MADYIPIVGLLIVSTLFVFGSFVASALLGPKRKETNKKIGPYECGIVPDSEPSERFPVKFYLVAMIFIIFDIEIIFLYPWAVQFNRLGLFGLMEMVIFTVAVVVSFVYLLSNGALDWGPVTRLHDMTDKVADTIGRTTASTIRKVGRPVVSDAAAASAEPAAAMAGQHDKEVAA